MGAIDDSRQLQQARAQQTRADILAKTHGGHEGPTGYTTDFTASGVGGLEGLRAMIEHADPAALDTVADHWKAVNKALLEAQTDFHTHTSAALEHWTGSAADGFAARAQQLHEALGNGAKYAEYAGSGVSAAATALTAAKKAMPTAPSEWQKISRRATSESSDQQFNTDLKSGISRQVALDLDGGQLSATEERHQQAIVVMQTLEGAYNSAGRTIGKAPGGLGDVTVWPPPPVTVTHDPVGSPDSEPVVGPGAVGALRLAQDGPPDRAGVVYRLAPGEGGPRTAVIGDRSEGITGGEKLPTAPGPSTTVTGISGGLGSGGGADSAVGMTGSPLPLISGVGGGPSQGRPGLGFGPGGVSVGFGGALGGVGDADAFGGGFNAAAEDFAASSASSGTSAVTGNQEPGQSPGTETPGSAAEEAMGMGGFPGGLGSHDTKRKRRPRPHYLVEDPESWESGVTFNPPVIK